MHNILEKTRAIVLHQLKYSDSSVVVHTYTRKFGRQAVMIKGMRKKGSGRHSIMFQPLFILEMEVYYKPSREIQLLKEFSLSWSPYGIYSDIRKSSVMVFLGEMLSLILKEESPHEDLFDYIERSVIWYGESTESFANFHISFLAGLSSYLGLQPSRQKDPTGILFSLGNGRFVPMPPADGEYASENISAILAQFFSSSFEEAARIPLTGRMRNEVLETMVKYYSIHLSLRKIKSLEVLKEVFG
jgi:DNA repair protein RecO (recombination protein O)